jgi:hypothetical protein|tara:strand:- start:41 stop:583 length:543 start_codon:yes stop_codon:yes gene_type:complete
MNKSKSFPLLNEDIVHSMKKSSSLSDIKESDYYFEEFFEGDGPLGIVFTRDLQSNIIVKNITPKTVAAETFGLQLHMKLINVNNTDITEMKYETTIKMIRSSWIKNNRVYLKFKKQIFPRLSQILNKYDLIQFYDNFVELGAKDETDLDYVEIGDLIQMDMTKIEIERFKRINQNIFEKK